MTYDGVPAGESIPEWPYPVRYEDEKEIAQGNTIRAAGLHSDKEVSFIGRKLLQGRNKL